MSEAFLQRGISTRKSSATSGWLVIKHKLAEKALASSDCIICTNKSNLQGKAAALALLNLKSVDHSASCTGQCLGATTMEEWFLISQTKYEGRLGR